jgi:hypothetical protein
MGRRMSVRVEGFGLCDERSAPVGRGFSGRVRRAHRMAGGRGPFSHRRSAGRGDAGRAFRSRRARALGRQFPADALRARRRRGAPRSDSRRFRGGQLQGAQLLPRRTRRLYTRLKLGGLRDAPIHMAVFSTKQPNRATTSARSPCRKRAAIRWSARSIRLARRTRPGPRRPLGLDPH